MSPKLILWLVFSLIASTWYALDPAAGGPFFSASTQVADVAHLAPDQPPRIAGG